jgi:hypothetical protein
MKPTPFELDLAVFRAAYPAFTEEKISDEQIQYLWGVVNAQLGDGKGNFLYPAPQNQAILFAALCHLVTLELNGRDQPGVLSSASEGSVSANFQNLQIKSETGQWWNQTKCGALFWVLTQKYRMGCRFYGSRHYHPWG